MTEHTFRVEVEGGALVDGRVEDLEDLYEVLAADPAVLGPAVGGNLKTGEVDVVLTVEAETLEEGAHIAGAAFTRALVATGRVSVPIQTEALATA